MTRNIKSNGTEYRIMLIIGIVIIILTYCYNINNTNLLYILGDEYGYWANAAYFDGYDWSGVTSYNTYYAFGYSLILVPLLFIKNYELRYQIAICINVLMQVGCFLMLVRMFSMLFPNIKKGLITIISLASIMYSSNIFQAKTTLAETMLCFCFVAIVYLVYFSYKTEKPIYKILLSFFSVLIFCTHMRGIGITVCVGGFYIVNCIINKKIYKSDILCICLIVLGLLAGTLLKDNIVHMLYADNATVAANDFSGQVGKLSLLASFEGILLLIKSMLGKLYYLFAATFLLIFWAVFWTLKYSFAGVRSFFKPHECRNVSSKNIIAIFLLFSFLATWLISSVYMIQQSDILDHLIYGRYNEYVLEPFLALGILELIEYRKNIKMSFAVMAVFFLLTVFVSNEFAGVENPSIREANIAGISWLAYNGQNVLYDSWELAIAIKVSIIYIILLVILNVEFMSTDFKIASASVICSTIWIISGIWLTDYQSDYRISYSTNEDIISFLDENNISDITYLLSDEYEYFDQLLPDILQYMSPTLEINYLEISRDSNGISDVDTILVRKGRNMRKYLKYDYAIAAESSSFYLYVRN